MKMLSLFEKVYVIILLSALLVTLGYMVWLAINDRDGDVIAFFIGLIVALILYIPVRIYFRQQKKVKHVA